jgi:hypothetical protein
VSQRQVQVKSVLPAGWHTRHRAAEQQRLEHRVGVAQVKW